jgi:hypothetical protein
MPMVSVLPSEKAQPTSWAFPPVDGSLTVPEIFDWNYEHNPQHPLFVHPKGNGQLEYTTMKQAVQAMHRVSHRYTSYLTAQGHAPSERDAPVVAIFGLTGMFDGFSVMDTYIISCSSRHYHVHLYLDGPRARWLYRLPHFASQFRCRTGAPVSPQERGSYSNLQRAWYQGNCSYCPRDYR